MALVSRKKTLLAKIESVYGTDPTPTGAANAILVRDLDITPLASTLVSRDLIRPYLGNSAQLLAESFVQLQFSVEMVGSGTVGVAPAYDPLLRACGFTKTVTTSAISITQVGNVATATLASHGYAVGDVVKITGATQSEYNISATILSVPLSSTFTFAVTGSPASPATGSPVVNTANVYAPVSASFESVTLYYNIDGVFHKVTGAFGSVEFGINVKNIPTFKFNFTGIYNAVTDAAAPTCVFTGFMTPQVVNTQNTPSWSLHSYGSSDLESCSININNQVEYITLVGSEEVKIVDRKPSGQISFEAPLTASKDYFAIARAGTSGALAFNHGSVSGYKVCVAAPAVSLGNPSYSDFQGIQMLNIPLTINPSSSGNDEISITIR